MDLFFNPLKYSQKFPNLCFCEIFELRLLESTQKINKWLCSLWESLFNGKTVQVITRTNFIPIKSVEGGDGMSRFELSNLEHYYLSVIKWKIFDKGVQQISTSEETFKKLKSRRTLFLELFQEVRVERVAKYRRHTWGVFEWLFRCSQFPLFFSFKFSIQERSHPLTT
jgi:hypothetical protein